MRAAKAHSLRTRTCCCTSSCSRRPPPPSSVSSSCAPALSPSVLPPPPPKLQARPPPPQEALATGPIASSRQRVAAGCAGAVFALPVAISALAVAGGEAGRWRRHRRRVRSKQSRWAPRPRLAMTATMARPHRHARYFLPFARHRLHPSAAALPPPRLSRTCRQARTRTQRRWAWRRPTAAAWVPSSCFGTFCPHRLCSAWWRGERWSWSRPRPRLEASLEVGRAAVVTMVMGSGVRACYASHPLIHATHNGRASGSRSAASIGRPDSSIYIWPRCVRAPAHAPRHAPRHGRQGVRASVACSPPLLLKPTLSLPPSLPPSLLTSLWALPAPPRPPSSPPASPPQRAQRWPQRAYSQRPARALPLWPLHGAHL